MAPQYNAAVTGRFHSRTTTVQKYSSPNTIESLSSRRTLGRRPSLSTGSTLLLLLPHGGDGKVPPEKLIGLGDFLRIADRDPLEVLPRQGKVSAPMQNVVARDVDRRLGPLLDRLLCVIDTS